MTEIDTMELAQLLEFDPEKGEIYWLPRPETMFASEQSCRTWNSRYAGKRAFTYVDVHGYMRGTIFDRPYFAHRVIWALAYRTWPAGQIDHINGDKTDNRLLNLRVVTNQENGRNQKRHRTNTSGMRGVCWDKKNLKWMARIKVDGFQKNLGRFDRYEDAVSKRIEAEATYGFHPNHGRAT